MEYLLRRAFCGVHFTIFVFCSGLYEVIFVEVIFVWKHSLKSFCGVPFAVVILLYP